MQTPSPLPHLGRRAKPRLTGTRRGTFCRVWNLGRSRASYFRLLPRQDPESPRRRSLSRRKYRRFPRQTAAFRRFRRRRRLQAVDSSSARPLLCQTTRAKRLGVFQGSSSIAESEQDPVPPAASVLFPAAFRVFKALYLQQNSAVSSSITFLLPPH